MNYKVFGLGYFFFLCMGLYLFGIFNPLLEFTVSVDPQQETVLRFLASFAYHGDLYVFWRLVVIDVVILILFSGVILWSEPNQFKSFTKAVVVGKFLVAYFFWLIATDPSESSTGCRFCFLINYLNYMLYYFLIISVLLIGFAQLNHVIEAKRHKENALESPPQVDVACPHCHAIYHSSVSFCVKCNHFLHE